MGSTTTAATFRERFRARLREEVVEAAYDITVNQGWDRVRMTTLAAAVGVSRQTLYREFGSKDEVAEALLMREVERFLHGVRQHAGTYDDLTDYLREATTFTLQHGAENPLLRSILAGAQTGQQSLLPHVTITPGRLLDTLGEEVRGNLHRRRPQLTPEELDVIVDALLRLTVSHLLGPTQEVSRTAELITSLVIAYADRP